MHRKLVKKQKSRNLAKKDAKCGIEQGCQISNIYIILFPTQTHKIIETFHRPIQNTSQR